MWEQITNDSGTYRLKVIRGWIVRYMITGYPAMVFILDIHHEWKISGKESNK